MHLDDVDPPQTHSAPPWIVTFADLMVLLMSFFVLMLSFSEMDPAKFKLMSGSMRDAFGVQTAVVASGIPRDSSPEAQELSPPAPEPTERNDARHDPADSGLDAQDLALEQRLREIKAQEDAAERQVEELRAVFFQEIDDGKLLIRQDGSNVVIQLLEKDSFPSGSADLEAGSRSTLARIGDLVNRMTGAITVSGHTDNVPVRVGSTYRSNWDLSAARAASVATELLAAGLAPTRLMVSGHADTQPRAANDTPANRALNRRVEITFTNGKDRPGNWSDALPAASGP